MTAIFAAVGVVAWLCVLLLCLGLARAAALGDLLVRRAVAAELRQAVAERRPRALAAERGSHVRRAA
jgi:hypothetical protein